MGGETNFHVEWDERRTIILSGMIDELSCLVGGETNYHVEWDERRTIMLSGMRDEL